jgi:hypothetical protein
VLLTSRSVNLGWIQPKNLIVILHNMRAVAGEGNSIVSGDKERRPAHLQTELVIPETAQKAIYGQSFAESAAALAPAYLHPPKASCGHTSRARSEGRCDVAYEEAACARYADWATSKARF